MDSSDDEEYNSCLADVKVKIETIENDSNYMYNNVKQESEEEFDENKHIKQEVFEFVDIIHNELVNDEDDPLLGGSRHLSLPQDTGSEANKKSKVQKATGSEIHKKLKTPRTSSAKNGSDVSSMSAYQRDDGLFYCPHCDKCCKRKEGLTLHLVKHDDSSNFSFRCTYCTNQAFKTKLELHYHMQKNHVEMESFNCTECSKVYLSQKRLDSHIMNKHSRMKNDDLYDCPFCYVYYETAAALKVHIKWLHTKKPICLICSEEFKDKNHLLNHMMVHPRDPDDDIVDVLEPPPDKNDDDIRLRKCGICRRIFETRSSLQHHMKKVHYTHNQYQCAHCNCKYISLRELKVHILNHKSDRKLFRCETCNKTYHFEHSLETHKMRGVCRKNPCECKVCGQIFMNSEYRRIHERQVHQIKRNKAFNKGKPPGEPVLCPHCGKSYVSKHTLNIHLRLHEDAKNFKCKFCDQAFKTQNNLRYHLGNFHFKSISDNNNPICTICNRQFNNKYTLNMHLIYKHKMPISSGSNINQSKE